MNPTPPKKPQTYFPQMERIRHLALIPPPVPLRCVLLWIWEGQLRQTEEVVVGLQATVADLYHASEREVGLACPRPRTLRAPDLFDAGWMPDTFTGGGQRVVYDVVIWDFEACAPRAITDDLSSSNSERLVAPASAADWWREELAAAAARLRQKCEPPEAP